MTDRNKFEEMLERLVNEDREGAEELFHEIVVERSREIYENLLSEDTDEEVDEATDEEVDESEDELDESDDEDLDESDDELDESDDDEIDENEFLEADPEDDMTMDIEMPGEEGGMDMGMDMDMDMEGGDEEPATQGDIKDLEAELEALKADFDALVAGDMDEPEDDAEEMPMDMDSEEGDDDMDDEGDDDDMDDEDKMPFESKGAKSQTEQMREYVEKVSATMGDNGANTKSTVAKPNNMGGTSANIAKGGDGGTGGTEGGLAAPSTKEDNAGNVNVPGAKGATKMSAQPGHGAEKKGKAPEQDGSAGSPLNGAPKRAK